MSLLRGRGRAVDLVFHDLCGDHAGGGGDLVGDAESRGEDLVGSNDFSEEVVDELVTGGIHGARGGEVEGLAGADEAREEEAATGFEAEPALAKDEPDFGFITNNADVCSERHCQTNTHSSTIDSCDGRFRTAIDGQADLSTLIAVLTKGRDLLMVAVEVHPRAEHAVRRVRGSQDDAFDASVAR